MPVSEPTQSTPLLLPTLSEERPNPTDWRPRLMTLWSEYDSEFQTSMSSLDEFLSQVEAFEISFEDLPKYIEFLESSFKDSEASRQAERVEAENALRKAAERIVDAEHARDRAKAVAAVLGGIAGILGLAFGVSVAF